MAPSKRHTKGGVGDTAVGFNQDMCMQPEDSTIIHKTNSKSVSMRLACLLRQCELNANLRERFLLISDHKSIHRALIWQTSLSTSSRILRRTIVQPAKSYGDRLFSPPCLNSLLGAISCPYSSHRPRHSAACGHFGRREMPCSSLACQRASQTRPLRSPSWWFPRPVPPL